MLRNPFSVYSDPKLLAILFLGFVSGIPLALTASTLGVWLTEAGVSKAAIGLFAAVATPYALKFLWSPLMDGTNFPILSRWLGRRCGWLIATQIALMLAILLLGLANPAVNPWLTAMCALLVAICSASQDIVIDAYRVEILKPEEYGAGAAAIVLGYRVGMITSTAGALYLASHVSWSATYAIMAGLIIIGMITVLISGEPEVEKTLKPEGRLSLRQWLAHYVIDPFADFMRRPYWPMILLFIVLYRLADSFGGVMLNPFLIDIGFTKEQIAAIVKLFGLIATITGGIIGGAMVARLGTTRSLMISGSGHALTNLLLVGQAYIGADPRFLALAISLENFTGGMSSSALVAYLSSLTTLRFTATQYALLGSFASIGRIWLSTPAGWFAEKLGWADFFLLASLMALPGLLVLWWLNRKPPTTY